MDGCCLCTLVLAAGVSEVFMVLCAGVLLMTFLWDSLMRSLRVRRKGVLLRVSLRLTALVRLWCCVYSPETPGDRPRSSVERTF